MIRALDVSKVHGHDNISVRIIKLCTNSVTHSLTLIFQSSMAAGIFATQWKRANIVLVHKKNDKQMYQIIDQYFFCLYAVKFLESLFSANVSNFLRTKISSKHQLGFHRSDSCIYQLLAITPDIFSSFDIAIQL